MFFRFTLNILENNFSLFAHEEKYELSKRNFLLFKKYKSSNKNSQNKI